MDHIAALETRLRWLKDLHKDMPNSLADRIKETLPEETLQKILEESPATYPSTIQGLKKEKHRIEERLGGLKDKRRELVKDHELTLRTGDTYFMNAKFCELVRGIAEVLPEDFEWDMNWLQSKNGWMLLEIPIHQVQAIGWRMLPMGSTFQSPEDKNITIEVASPVVEFVIFNEGRFQEESFRLGGRWMFGDALKYDKKNMNYDEISVAQAGVIFASFHLMSQRLATCLEKKLERHVRRRMAKDSAPPEIPSLVRIITLRRMEADRKEDPNGQSPDWNWKWIVRVHQRKQWFPSEQKHKWITIESYIKGPDNKPLKPPQHLIFKAER